MLLMRLQTKIQIQSYGKGSSILRKSNFRELSFLILGTGVEEFLEGCQFFCHVLLGYQIILPGHDGPIQFNPCTTFDMHKNKYSICTVT